METTKRQLEVLEFMEASAKTVYPTVREIASHFGLSVATAHQHVIALKKRGLVPEGEKRRRFTLKPVVN